MASEFLSWNGYFPILIFLAIPIAMNFYFYIYDRGLIFKWINENDRYLVRKDGVKYPWWGVRGNARIFAIDTDSGDKVEIALRVGSKFWRGVRLDNAVCESITRL